jgi:hypothetical protein
VPRPIGIFLIALFFAASTCVVLSVGTALVWQGTALDAVWDIYPSRRGMLMPWRSLLGPLFLGLAIPMAAASVGCFLRRRWGWWLAVLIFAANGAGDMVQLFLGRYVEGGVGVLAAGAILFYLMRPEVRTGLA